MNYWYALPRLRGMEWGAGSIPVVPEQRANPCGEGFDLIFKVDLYFPESGECPDRIELYLEGYKRASFSTPQMRCDAACTTHYTLPILCRP